MNSVPPWFNLLLDPDNRLIMNQGLSRVDCPEYSEPSTRSAFIRYLASRYDRERVTRIIEWMDTPFEELDDHQKQVVNLLLRWCSLCSLMAGSMGKRLSCARTLTATPAHLRPLPRVESEPLRIE